MTLLTVEHPDWMLDAECTRANPEVFYPEPAGRSVAAAKKICATCAVRAECLQFALDRGEVNFGVWGGLSAKERQRIQPPSQRAVRRKVARCGTASGYKAHRRRGEPPCIPCRNAYAAAHREYMAGQAASRSKSKTREKISA